MILANRLLIHFILDKSQWVLFLVRSPKDGELFGLEWGMVVGRYISKYII